MWLDRAVGSDSGTLGPRVSSGFGRDAPGSGGVAPSLLSRRPAASRGSSRTSTARAEQHHRPGGPVSNSWGSLQRQDTVRLTGWKGGRFLGLRVSTLDRERLFRSLRKRLDQEGLILVLPAADTAALVDIPMTKRAFWKGCPAFRSGEIGAWMKDRGDCPWPYRSPPAYTAELVAPSTGRLVLTVHTGPAVTAPST